MLGFLLIFIGVVCIVASFLIPNNQKGKTTGTDMNVEKILDYYLKHGFITEAEYIDFQCMDNQRQMEWMNEQFRQMNEMQQQQFMMEMHLQQAEMARLMSTGIEFGGFNPDINLNPGQQMMQNDIMNQMNNNNMGGPGMF